MSIISAHTPLTISEVQKREGYDDSEAVLGEMQQMNIILIPTGQKARVKVETKEAENAKNQNT